MTRTVHPVRFFVSRCVCRSLAVGALAVLPVVSIAFSAEAQICAPLYNEHGFVNVTDFAEPVSGLGRTWIRTNRSVHSITPDGSIQTWNFRSNVLTMAAIGNFVWVGTSEGAYRFGPTEAQVHLGPVMRVETIEQMFGSTVIFGDARTYRVGANDEFELTALPPGPVRVLSGSQVPGSLRRRLYIDTHHSSQNTPLFLSRCVQ